MSLQPQSFQVLQCSSEDPDYLASNLTLHHRPAGWLSARFCQHPQRLVLFFHKPVFLRMLIVTAHPYKIPQSLQVDVSFKRGSEFRALGTLAFSSNEHSNYTAREAQQLQVNSPCQLLRLTCASPHPNPKNPYSQVGIYSVCAYADHRLPEHQLQQQIGRRVSQQFQELHFDGITLEQLSKLEQEKQKALRQEDYGRAKELSEAIKQLRAAGPVLMQLEQRRQYALKVEDYDSAQVLTQQIRKIRGSLGVKLVELKPSSIPTHPPLGERAQSQFIQPPRQQTPQRPPSQIIPTRTKKYAPQRLVIPPRQPTPQRIPTSVSQQTQQIEPRPSPKPKPRIRPKPSSNENTVLPEAKKLPAQPKPSKQPEQAGSDLKLTEEQRVDVENYLKFVPESVWCKVLSKVRAQREEGLAQLNRIDCQSPDALLLAVVRCIEDTFNPVFFEAAALLVQAVKRFSPKQSVESCFQIITTTLLDRLADVHSKVRIVAKRTLLDISSAPLFSARAIVDQILKFKDRKGPKLLAARLQVLTELMPQTKADIPFDQLMQFLSGCLESSNSGVRKAAMAAVESLASYVSKDKILSAVKTLGSKTLQAVKKVLSGKEEVAERQPSVQKRGGRRSKQKRSREKEGSKSKRAKQDSLSKRQKRDSVDQKEGGVVDPDSACPFCDMVKREFLDPEKLDAHLLKDCPFTTACEECQLIVPIPHLAQHLISECPNSAYFRRCGRCKEPVHQRVFKNHTVLKECLPAKETLGRCLLCHQHIGPGKEGWKKHLLDEGCPSR